MAKYPAYAVGQRLTADLVSLGQKNTVVKLTGTSRASVTTYSDDPELTISGEAGTFCIELDMIASGAAAASGGDINVQWTTTGTFLSGAYRCTGGASVITENPTGVTTTRWRTHALGTVTPFGYPTDSGATNLTTIHEIVPAATFTTAWSVTIQWTQASSNATATIVYNGSTLSATRLA